jgi:hypothetical protein
LAWQACRGNSAQAHNNLLVGPVRQHSPPHTHTHTHTRAPPRQGLLSSRAPWRGSERSVHPPMPSPSSPPASPALWQCPRARWRPQGAGRCTPHGPRGLRWRPPAAPPPCIRGCPGWRRCRPPPPQHTRTRRRSGHTSNQSRPPPALGPGRRPGAPLAACQKSGEAHACTFHSTVVRGAGETAHTQASRAAHTTRTGTRSQTRAFHARARARTK